MTLSAERAAQAPQIHTALPGPNAAAIIERDKAVISPSYTRGYPFVIKDGLGAVVEDVDGNTFLDYCAGIAVCATGHNHPKIVEAIQQQAGQFLHMSGTDFYYDHMATLGERLAKTMPLYTNPDGNPSQAYRSFFCNSGAEAIEGALKLARYHTGRQGIISFFRGFHGRTYGAMSVTGSKSIQKKRFSPLVSGIHHALYPYHYQEPKGATPEETANECLRYIQEFLFGKLIQPDEVAAFLVEPIQGEGGYVVPPDNFLIGLQKLAQAHGILIIADEVQAGAGRTGEYWASNHVDGFTPDIMTSAKGLASGLPLGAIIAKHHVMNWVPGVHATTFGGNPVACASALATMDLLENGLQENATKQGDYLQKKLHALQQEFDIIGDIRGKGLMVGMELVHDRETKRKAKGLRDAIVDKAFYNGLIILGCGENAIRFSPPLVITEAQTDKAIDILTQTMRECL
jgi:4-aminobutyrate aminotransferase